MTSSFPSPRRSLGEPGRAGALPAGGQGRRSSFVGRITRLHAELTRAGLGAADMRKAEPLELQMLVAPDPDRFDEGDTVVREIARLEGTPIAARPVPKGMPPSRLRYFLDGSQRTLPVSYVGLTPICAVVSAAGVLERDGRGNPRVAAGTLEMRHTWLVPNTGDRHVSEVLRVLADHGADVADPLHGLNDADRAAAIGNYGVLQKLAYRGARQVRAALEDEVLRGWIARPGAAEDDGWIVVDGALRMAAPRAIGLVKSFSVQYLQGEEAVTLFGLPHGHRTSAFQAIDAWRAPDPRTLWYLRLWDAAGRDPRHALVRVETAADVAQTARIDELSAWLMAERIPRATADARWATLLYPVHYLEQILKRYVDADTRGWPGTRAGR